MIDITITVKKKRSGVLFAEESGSPIRVRQPKRALKRRLKKGGGIELFDLASYLDSSRVQEPFTWANWADTDPTIPSMTVAAFYASIESQILGRDQATLFANVKPIEKDTPAAEMISAIVETGAGYQVLNGIDEFEDTILTVANINDLSILSSSTGSFFQTNVELSNESVQPGVGIFKVTALPSYASSAVPFSLQANDKIGIMPALSSIYGTVDDSGVWSQMLGGGGDTLPRTITQWGQFGGDPFDYESAYYFWDVARENSMIQAIEFNSSVPTPISPSAFAPIGTYPAPPATPSPGNNFGYSIGSAILFEGILAYIVKRGSDLYYIWHI